MATSSQRQRLRTDDEDQPHTTSQIDWKNFSYRDLVKALTGQEAQEFARAVALIDYGPSPALVRTSFLVSTPPELLQKKIK